MTPYSYAVTTKVNCYQTDCSSTQLTLIDSNILDLREITAQEEFLLWIYQYCGL